MTEKEERLELIKIRHAELKEEEALIEDIFPYAPFVEDLPQDRLAKFVADGSLGDWL